MTARRNVLIVFVLLCLFTVAEARKPNFIIIFTDDQGYSDLGCFGSKTIKTPNIDRMAEQGRRFTSFYVPANVCTPSRSALMTGCYPKRVDMHVGVLFPSSKHGLNPKEVTIAEILKTQGYKTACIGKWHLGDNKEFLPTRQGFDSYYGIPYSNDMSHPDNKKRGNLLGWKDQDADWKKWNTPLFENERIAEMPVNQRTITRRYTNKAIEFINENRKKRFFLYLAHSMPHVPLFVPEDVYEADGKRPYDNVIEHIDAEVGRILKAVESMRLSKDTYIIFTSDNGPWLRYGKFGGSAKPLNNGKGTTFEGGHRVPCVMMGPKIPKGTTTDAFTTTMDLLPTLAKLGGARLETRGKIDGLDIIDVMRGSDKSPRNEMLYYARRGVISGLRQGDWKIRGKELYNLKDDISEKKNLAKEMPEKFEALKKRMLELDAEITKNKRRKGTVKTAR